MGNRSHRLARLVEIITLVQSGEKWGPKQLAQHFGISERRIYHDIKELGVAGVPIAYSRKVYTINPSFFLPALNLTTREIHHLLFPDHHFSGDQARPINDSIRAKLLSCLPASMRAMLGESLERIHMKPEATTQRDDNFELIHQAVAESRRTVIEYCSLDNDGYKERTVDPLGLHYRNHAWYMIAFCRKNSEIRTFKLNRTRKAALTPIVFPYPEGFSIDEHLAGRWGIFDGEEEEVIIRFSPRAAKLVKDKPPVKNGAFMEMSDGSAIFKAHIRGTQEIAWWIMKYGDQAEVIRPLHIREQVIETIRKMSVLYGILAYQPLAAEEEAGYGPPAAE
ncbi:MAG: WYL domain-containing transcriptional regulator [Planctomycetes bacterium]|nr:WYL domain-containing transcriptional regulator [Planctomycetota bacterium]